MPSYPEAALLCGNANNAYSEDEIGMLATQRSKHLPEKKRFPVESILAFLPIHVRYQAWNNVAHLKKLLQKDYANMLLWDIDNMHKNLLHIMMTSLQHVSFAKSRAMSVAIYVSQQNRKLCYLPYPLKAMVVYNRPLSVISLPDVENDIARQYIVITFSSTYVSFFQGCGKTLTAISRLSVKADDSYVKDTDRLLEDYLINKPLPVFVMGLPVMVNHFISLTTWQFNIADILLTEAGIKASFIAVLLDLWFKQRIVTTAPDENHAPG